VTGAIHPKAQAFGPAAEDYAAGRPDYPHALRAWLAEALGLGADRRVIELGAGTGKFTPLLIATGAEVLAVEPVAGMRARLAGLAGVTAVEGTASAIPAPDGWADAVVSAQAFHWFATSEALNEIARVLRPGARLGLVWNATDDRSPWAARIRRIIAAHEGDSPRHASGEWRSAFPHPAFGPLHETRFDHGHTGPPEQVIVQRMTSISYIAALAPAERAKVVETVRALIAAESELAGRTEVTVPYETRAYWTERHG
jgi:SAM-dependent methyltransferase